VLSATAVEADGSSWQPPEPVDRAVMVQLWESLAFLHWPYESTDVQRLLPRRLSVDTFDGMAWVGLVPFRLTVRAPLLPRAPWATRFPEINVRTYVRGPDGRRGIFFLSLEAARLGAVMAARRWYRLPYMWARMGIEASGDEVRYRSLRRWPGFRWPSTDIRVKVGDAIDPAAVSALERFLVARWRLYTPTPTGLTATQVEHGPWPLRKARVVSCRDELLCAAGLPEPSGVALAHFSPGVRARFARRVRL
jgi:uncharacterized protein YqjF (DUF2071 family)